MESKPLFGSLHRPLAGENKKLTLAYAPVFYTGSILATGTVYASAKADGELAFRLPFSLQLIPPFFIMIGTFLIPESPRWLTRTGKRDQAASILAKYHGGGDPNHPVVLMEMREFEESIEMQRSSSLWNYFELYVARHTSAERASLSDMDLASIPTTTAGDLP